MTEEQIANIIGKRFSGDYDFTKKDDLRQPSNEEGEQTPSASEARIDDIINSHFSGEYDITKKDDAPKPPQQEQEGIRICS